jgi:hypothetical protein
LKFQKQRKRYKLKRKILVVILNGFTNVRTC